MCLIAAVISLPSEADKELSRTIPSHRINVLLSLGATILLWLYSLVPCGVNYIAIMATMYLLKVETMIFSPIGDKVRSHNNALTTTSSTDDCKGQKSCRVSFASWRQRCCFACGTPWKL